MKHIKRITKKVTKKAAKKKVEPENKSADAAVAPEPEKIFDVAKPGETMADAGSKPIIPAKGAPMQDPMVTPIQTPSAKEPSEVPEDAVMASVEEKSEIKATKNRIEPLHEVSDADGVVASPDERAQAPDSKGSGDDSDSEQSDEASDLSLRDQQQTAKTAEDAATEKRQEQANAFIDSKAYFVPINSVKKRRSMRVLLVVIIVFILLIGFLYAWDAGIVNIGVSPPFDFIPN